MSLPMNSLYSLTWGDYGTSLVSAVQLLRCHGDLVDCTLAAGGRSFPAHKIVLCAASPFLLDLLKVKCCVFFFSYFKFLKHFTRESVLHTLHRIAIAYQSTTTLRFFYCDLSEFLMCAFCVSVCSI